MTTDINVIYKNLCDVVTKTLASHGIQRENACVCMIISYSQVRNALIRQEYSNRHSVNAEIATKFGMTTGTIREIVHNRR